MLTCVWPQEVVAWKGLAPKTISEYRNAQTGLLDEVAMMSDLQTQFPLHSTVFCQVACHLMHEANVENTFSTAGGLSDPNINRDFLSKLVRISGRKTRFKPAWKRILERYRKKFGKIDELYLSDSENGSDDDDGD